MVQQLHPTPAPERLALVDPCPRCGSTAVRAIVYGPLDFEVEAQVGASGVAVDGFSIDDAPVFDCRECGFEWGLAVRDLLG